MKKYVLLLYTLCCHFAVNAQSKITGTVYDASDKHPLYGVTVKIKGTHTSVATDKEGRFDLPFSGTPILLELSSIGYKNQNTPLNNLNDVPIKIFLEQEINQLKEVIVSNGYQELPKERSTGSFTSLDNKLLNQQVGANILNRLESITSGLTFDRATNATGNILIRGLSTINGPKSPLIVLDNFPYEGDVNNINPNDVESITILKDAAAASIWGTRAGNGVIVITTKKGRFNQPLSIDFNSNITLNAKPDLSYIKQMSSNDYINVEQMLFNNGYYDGQLSDPYHQALSPVVELLSAQRNGAISVIQANTQLNALRNVDVRNDFNKYLYQQGVNQQYALNIRGGSAYNAWLLSGGYDKDISNLDADYNRINLRFQNTLNLFKKLQLTTALYYTQSKTTSGKPGYGDITNNNGTLYPYTQLADANGNPLPFAKDYSLSYLSTLNNSPLLDWKYYPLTDYKHIINTTNVQDVVANVGLNYKVANWLSADVKYQYERQQSDGRGLQDQDSYYTRNLVNFYTQIDPITGKVTNAIPKGSIFDLSNTLLQAHNLRGQLNFNKTWARNEVTAIAGGELRQINIGSNSNRLYGYNDNMLGYGNVDYYNTYPTFISGYPLNIPNGSGISDLTNRYVSLFGNAAYTYDQKYTLSGSIRRDASNLFGVHTNDKWKPLWSAGGSWNISNEPFYKLSFLPYLKLRATYGFSGNVNQSRTAVTTLRYSSSASPYTQSSYANFSNYGNPDLRWETAGIINIGLDFNSQDSRISGSLEYYHKKGTDLFGRALIDITAGVGSTIVKNAADMRGDGFDVVLNTINLNGAIKWTSNFNISFYRDIVTKYDLPSATSVYLVTSNATISGVAGKPVYSIFAYKWAGLDPQTGDPRGYLNGSISKDYTAIESSDYSTLKYIGSALPTHFGSIGNTVSWRNFSITARVTYKLGYYFRSRTIQYSSLFDYGSGHSDFALRWQKPGDEKITNVPSLVYPTSAERDIFYSSSEAFVEKGDHVRLQYVTLGYELNKDNWKGNPFKSLQIYLNANNLGIIWRANKKGIDPDYYTSDTVLPPSKNIAIGVKASF
jgi:TonB-linked SusC/RagA family outer membrane protein